MARQPRKTCKFQRRFCPNGQENTPKICYKQTRFIKNHMPYSRSKNSPQQCPCKERIYELVIYIVNFENLSHDQNSKSKSKNKHQPVISQFKTKNIYAFIRIPNAKLGI